jgi:hypothetical protein
MAHDVFISHSAKDKTIADAVCATLESEGIRCWIAPRDVAPGREFGKCIIEAIKQSRIMVLVFTANANDSAPVRKEVERAVNHGVVILPFRVENVIPDEALEFFIGNVHWLDALSAPFEAHLNHLAKAIKVLLAPIEASAGQAEPRAVTPIAAAEGKTPEGKTTRVESRRGDSSEGDGSHDLAKGNLTVNSPDSVSERATVDISKRRRVRMWALGGAVALVLVLAAILVVRFRLGWNSTGSSPQAAQPVVAGGSAGQGGSPAAQSPQPGGSPASSSVPAAGAGPDGSSAGAPSATSAATQELALEAKRLILQKQYSEAMHLAEQACDGGSADSCVNVGWLYETGHGVARDYSRAASFYQRACDGGSAEGCFNLGADYDAGKGVALNYAQGAVLFQKACDGGSAEGCGDLGELYAKGLGVAQDSAKGTLLLQKGCSGGDQKACSQLTRVQ